MSQNASTQIDSVETPKRGSASIIGGSQSEIFPRKVLRIDPPTKRTADSIGEAEADDNCRYVIKSDSNGKPVRASEWLCTCIADRIGLAVPQSKCLEMQSGETVFGSRRLAGVADQTVSLALLLGQISQPQSVVSICRSLSCIYAYDLAIHNTDRHLNNYLCVNENNTLRIFAFDFSRSLLWHWPWPGIVDVNSNTRRWGKMLRAIHGFDVVAAVEVLDRLAKLAPSAIERFIDDMPDDWMGGVLRSEILAWWSGIERERHLEQVRQGLRDGTLL